MLIICPASLRKQWSLELSEKFNLPNVVLDAKTYKDFIKQGVSNPFFQPQILIASMHFAAARQLDVGQIAWDLVVFDEAHKLRNAYRESSKLGNAIRTMTDGRKKLLLTATPLHNSLLELYGISTLINENLFGELPSFRSQYMGVDADLEGLRNRLAHFTWRTLRRQVTEYVRYNERKLITRPFKPTDEEHQLYEQISEYLQQEQTYALPKGQRHLITLLIRKVLASSPFAVAGTLTILSDRLKRLREETIQSQKNKPKKV